MTAVDAVSQSYVLLFFLTSFLFVLVLSLTPLLSMCCHISYSFLVVRLLAVLSRLRGGGFSSSGSDGVFAPFLSSAGKPGVSLRGRDGLQSEVQVRVL